MGLRLSSDERASRRPDRSQSGKRRGRVVIATAIAILGIAILYVSWSLRDLDPWWSSTLSNIAVAVILLSPAELAITGVRNGFRRIQAVSEGALETAHEAKTAADATAQSLEDIRNGLLQRQQLDLRNTIDSYLNITKNPSRVTLLEALRTATNDELITKDGVRSPIWETYLHYRYVVDGPDHELVVQLEEDDGAVISSHVWERDELASDFYQRLVIAVRDAGADLGTGLNDPTQSVEELAKMLGDVVALRSQELLGHRNALRRIIERVDGTYFTEEQVIPAGHLYYSIGRDQLSDMDWEEHLQKKGWYDAAAAIPFARRLYGI